MTAPVASGWSGCRVGLAPTGKRRLSTAHTQSRPFVVWGRSLSFVEPECSTRKSFGGLKGAHSLAQASGPFGVVARCMREDFPLVGLWTQHRALRGIGFDVVADKRRDLSP